MPPSCLLYRRLWAQVDAVLGQGSSSSSIKAAVVISHAVKRAMVSAIYSSMPPQQQQAASRHSSSDDLSSFSSQPVQDLVLLHVSGNGSAELMQQVPVSCRQQPCVQDEDESWAAGGACLVHVMCQRMPRCCTCVHMCAWQLAAGGRNG
jgi:hypothetical protein